MGDSLMDDHVCHAHTQDVHPCEVPSVHAVSQAWGEALEKKGTVVPHACRCHGIYDAIWLIMSPFLIVATAQQGPCFCDDTW